MLQLGQPATIAAERALQRGGVAAPVQEQDDLLLAFEPLGDGLLELRREDRNAFALAQRLAHVHDAHHRHLLVVGPLEHLQQRVFALGAVVVALHRGRRRTQHHRRPFHPPAHDGHVARVIARRLLLLVGVLVLLVHDDQAQRVDRRENGRAGADDDAGAALADLVPFIVALAGRQMAVQHRHQRLERAGTEPRLEPLDRLRRQRNLRHQHDAALALLQRVGEACKIHLGLAAAGHPVQQERPRRAGRGERGAGERGSEAGSPTPQRKWRSN